MKLGGVTVAVLMVGSTLGCLGIVPVLGGQENGHSAGSRNENAVLKYLRPALNSAGKSGRIYYRGTCKAKGWDPIQFPLTEVEPLPKNETDRTAIQEMFRNDKDVTVTEGQSGIIKIRIGKVSAAILQTRVSLLTLNAAEQYNPTRAISAIESTRDVVDAMRRLRVRPVSSLFGLEAIPAEGLPHLPTSMKNVTVDQALDSIASTFRGIVVYGECPQTDVAHQFYIGFAGLVGFDDATPSAADNPRTGPARHE